MKSLRAWVIACAVVAGAAIAGCGGAGGITTSAAPTTNNTAVVRFVNGSPDNGAVDVYINGVAVYSAINYGTVTPYYLLKSGVQTTVDIYASGSVSPDLVPQIKATYTTGQTTSIVLEGKKSSSPATLVAQSFAEPTYTSTVGQFAVIYHHASPAQGGSLSIGAFTPNPIATATATAAATATATPTPVATPTSLVTVAPSIAPFPAPSGANFTTYAQQITYVAPTSNIATAAANTNTVLIPMAAPTTQPLAFFASPVNGGTSYCIAPMACAAQLGPNNVIAPVDYDTTDITNTVPDGGNYHMSIFVLDSTPPYTFQLAAGFD